ncbi:nucleoside deaminase [Leeuwenhoekiella aequorea]|uniref:tRNA(Arg) A34 adenosine deaminase TadA n=1 Tax=Leeuwenhoekiella aequorea TaxID=283736 RepID=A0A4Q0PA33_9FLAO|nr:nucleoside deaminase [Leeuwenhoekiella aequorea]RXG23455.1 tRNA(Arg) A34 adenosine deaminase TadA [Leeuwenhoekiella aequorea]
MEEEPLEQVVVKDGEVIAEGHNQVGITQDCTQHAEIAVIQEACKKLGSKSLEDCILYTSCELCLMCLGATRWASLSVIYFSGSAEDAKNAGYIYSDLFYRSTIEKRYNEFNLKQLLQAEAFAVWKRTL